VYRDGILIAEVDMPGPLRARQEYMPLPQPALRVNLPKSRVPMTDLARVHLKGASQRWDAPISDALLREFRSRKLAKVVSLPPEERLFQLARFLAAYAIDAEYLWEHFPPEKWPVACLEPGGRLTALEFGDLTGREVFVLPECLDGEGATMAIRLWMSQAEYEGVLKHWAGEACCLQALGYGSPFSPISQMWEASVGQTHALASVRFLVPPWDGDPPLAQWVLTPKDPRSGKMSPKDLLEKGAQDPLLLAPHEWEYCAKLPDDMRIALFQSPFEHCFAYANKPWNLNHPATQAVLRVIARGRLAQMAEQLSKAQLGEFADALRKTAICAGEQPDTWIGRLLRFFAVGRRLRLLDVADPEALIPSADDFVPGSWGFGRPYADFRIERLRGFRPFGQVQR
jgi:hypothetical protein